MVSGGHRCHINLSGPIRGAQFVPEIWVWGGGAVITGSFVYIVRREAELAKKPADYDLKVVLYSGIREFPF